MAAWPHTSSAKPPQLRFIWSYLYCSWSWPMVRVKKTNSPPCWRLSKWRGSWREMKVKVRGQRMTRLLWEKGGRVLFSFYCFWKQEKYTFSPPNWITCLTSVRKYHLSQTSYEPLCQVFYCNDTLRPFVDKSINYMSVNLLSTCQAAVKALLN